MLEESGVVELRGISFPAICNASGAQGFFGEGYPYHAYWKYAGLTFDRCGFVAKTTTLDERPGNMPLKEDGITPKEYQPKCIIVKPFKGVLLNAVGLSGPGAYTLFGKQGWQMRTRPFFISFMSVKSTIDERLQELGTFVKLFHQHLADLSWPVGLEMNFSCPNAGLNPFELINETSLALDIAASLNIPLQCKFNATVPPMAVARVSKHPACDAITISNTIPWGMLPDKIDWYGLFGSEKSPLADLGGGGLSGWPLLPIVCDWIRNARSCGLTKPIWACGGVDSAWAVRQAKIAGANGVQIGSVAILRPWRMKRIIRAARELF